MWKNSPFKEADWKYMRSIQKDLLNVLCSRINEQAIAIVNADSGTAHECYVKLFKHIEKSDRVVAVCFDDWRRSKLRELILSLRKHKLLKNSHIENFSESGQTWIEQIEAELKQ